MTVETLAGELAFFRSEYRKEKQKNHVLTRRLRMVEARRKGNHTKSEWKKLKNEFNGSCVRCLIGHERITKDHIIPIYQGGSNGIDNIQPLCQKCNSSKGAENINWKEIRRKEKMSC